MMAFIFSLAVGLFFGCALWFLLRPYGIALFLGVAFFSYASNLFVFALSNSQRRKAAFFPAHEAHHFLPIEAYADPLPQALLLTSVILGFGLIVFLLQFSLKSNLDMHKKAKDKEDDNG